MPTLARPMPERWAEGNPNNSIWGADLASAATIAPTHGYHVVTGTAEIATITPPWDGFAGKLVLVFTGAATFATSGNIAKTGTAVAATAMVFVYNPVTAKWYFQVP